VLVAVGALAAPAVALADSDGTSAPLTVPAGRVALDGIFPLFNDRAPTPGGFTDQFAVGAELNGSYGVSDTLEVGLDVGISLRTSDAAPELTVRGADAVLHGDKTDLVAAVAVGVDTHHNGTIFLSAGAWFRYRVDGKLSLFTGQPALVPQVGLGVPFDPFFGAVPYQLAIAVNNGNSAGLAVPVGASYQVTPRLLAYAQVVLADFLLGGGTVTSLLVGADFIPITVAAWYAPTPCLGLGVSLGDDLRNAGEFYALTLAVRYWVK
jgi:hypothetical protein